MADEELTNEHENNEEHSNGDSSLKRKRADSLNGYDGTHDPDASQEDAKKLKLDETGKSVKGSSSSAVTVLSETSDSMVVQIPCDKVGQLIGSKGMVIQEVQQKSGAKAVVNQDFPPGVPRQVQVNGTPQQMRAALDLIKRIIEIGATAIHANSLSGGPTISTIIEANVSQIGKIIGTGGANIKEIQSKSGARVQIDQDYPPDVPRKVNITGTTTAVNIAVQMVQSIMTGGQLNRSLGTATPALAPPPSFSAYQQPPAFGAPPAVGAEVRNTMDVAKAIIGKIIGKGGETIKLIKQKSGCEVKVDQQVPEGYPCKVNFIGTAQAVAIAQHLVQEIMIGVPIHKLGANLPQNIQPTVAASYPAAAPPAQAAYPGVPQYTMPVPQQPAFPYAYPPQPYPGAQPYPYAMPGYPPYGQPAAAPAMAPGGYGAMPGAAGAYSAYPHAAAAAPVAAKAAAPAAAAKPNGSVWTEHKTDDGIPYWYNASTGVSQWERPKNM